MIYVASIQNFETGNLSGLQNCRLTDHYITEEGGICLGQNGGQSRGRYEVFVGESAGNRKEITQGARPMPGTAKRRSLWERIVKQLTGRKEIGEGT